MVQNLFRHAQAVGLPVIFDGSDQLSGDFGLYDDPGLPQLEHTLQGFPDLVLLGHGPVFWSEIGRLETLAQQNNTSRSGLDEVQSRLQMLLRLVKTDTNPRLLQEPTLTMVNNRPATIFVGEAVRYAQARVEQGQARIRDTSLPGVTGYGEVLGNRHAGDVNVAVAVHVDVANDVERAAASQVGGVDELPVGIELDDEALLLGERRVDGVSGDRQAVRACDAGKPQVAGPVGEDFKYCIVLKAFFLIYMLDEVPVIINDYNSILDSTKGIIFILQGCSAKDLETLKHFIYRNIPFLQF